MFFKKIIFCFIVLFSVNLICNQDLTIKGSSDSSLCNTEESCTNPNNPCKVFCAFECGPRDKKPDDELLWQKGINTYVCYGKTRDKENLHRCVQK